MAKTAKCHGEGCTKQLLPSERFKHGSKNYCNECYQIVLKESEDYKMLINSICQYWDISSPTGLIIKQIKEYKDTYGYTNGGITYCLWYITNILSMRLELKYGIAKVKFYYEESKSYFLQQQAIEDSVVKPIENVIVRKVNLPNNHKQKQTLLLDIDNL